MTASRQRRQLLDRLRSRTDRATTPEPVALSAPPVVTPEPEPAPPRREHLFGSQYRLRLSFGELMETRGYTGERVLRGLRVAETTDAQRQRDTATRRAAPDTYPAKCFGCRTKARRGERRC